MLTNTLLYHLVDNPLAGLCFLCVSCAPCTEGITVLTPFCTSWQLSVMSFAVCKA